MPTENVKTLLLKTSLLAIFLVAACTPFSRQALNQVDTDAPFRQVQSDPEKYRGKTVLWGGSIINTDVRDIGTYIKVLETDLDYEKMPVKLDHPRGRFIIFKPGFLDPAVYRQGSKITVIGAVIAREVLPVGAVEYTYPVIEAKELYLWRPVTVEPVYSPADPFAWGWRLDAGSARTESWNKRPE
jgi:outer membrane lipoprotein